MQKSSNRTPWPVLLFLAIYIAAAFCLRQSAPAAPAPSIDPTIDTPSSQPTAPADETDVSNLPAAVPAVSPLVIPVEPYDFSQPAPESKAVDTDYFADAAFVGDSRTDGLMIYSGVGCGDKYVSNGLSIFQLDSKKALTIAGESYTLLEALSQKQYGKVYLCLGINELGVNNADGFYSSYCSAIDAIRTIQPNAVIYIQGLIPLNEEVVAQTIKRDYLKNDRLRLHNDLMRKAAEEKQVVFLDLHSAFVNENGELPAEASRDGVHLLKEGYEQWLSYLQTHTVTYEALYPDGAPVVEPSTEPESALTGEPENGSVDG